jgi:GNAT superfamily N-acetyltransferase
MTLVLGKLDPYEILIRPAGKSDLPAVIQMYAQPDLDNGSVLSATAAEMIYDKMKSYPNYQIYVAEVEGQLVGTFALIILDNLIHLGSPSGVVEAVAVAPEWQGKGIGKAMMRYAWNLCQRAGCYKLTLSSNLKRHRAHAFYESLGFKKHGFSFRTDRVD